MAETKKVYRRASEIVKGIGLNLDEVIGKDVLLHHFAITERPMDGEQRTCVILEISVDYEKDAETQETFHAWSQPLADKLAELGDDDLPVVIQFKKVQTRAKQMVWTFE